MNKIIRNTLAGFMVITCGIAAVAQPTEQKILLTINNEPVTAGEFQGLYLKSTSIENAKPTREVLEDYLNLFINYKLKVKAAKDNGIDTTAAFKNEYQGYVEQLAQSYLIDNQVLNNLIEEAYNRMQYEVSASHILISIPGGSFKNSKGRNIWLSSSCNEQRSLGFEEQWLSRLLHRISNGLPFRISCLLHPC